MKKFNNYNPFKKGTSSNSASHSTPDSSSSPKSQEAPATPASGKDLHKEHDKKTRRRDQHGNRIPWWGAYSIPLIDTTPIENTPLEKTIKVIEEKDPISANRLRHEYNNKLINSVGRVKEVHDQEEALMNARNEQAAALNSEIDLRQAQLEEERDSATSEHYSKLTALDSVIENAHCNTAQKVADAGGAYDPSNPSESCVLRHQPQNLEIISSNMKLPWTPDDQLVMLSKQAAFVITMVIGIVLGLSFGLLTGFLSVSNLFGNLPVLFLWFTIGSIAAWVGKLFIFHTFRETSVHYWLGRPWKNWVPMGILAFAVAASILAIDSHVEREGLLAKARLDDSTQALSGGSRSAADRERKEEERSKRDTIFLLASILMTFGYVGTSAAEGYLNGRSAACYNRLLERQEVDFRQIDTEVRSQSFVQIALSSIGEVKELLRQRSIIVSRINEIETPYNNEIAQLESNRKTLETELSEYAKDRIQDAIDNTNGAQRDFNAMLDDVLSGKGTATINFGFWKRLLQRLGKSYPGDGNTKHKKL